MIPKINWSDPNSFVTPHFTVKDACFLHKWNRLATSADGMDGIKLEALCKKLEEVRIILNCPMNIHCMFRSADYNKEQRILLPTGMDVHAMNLAVDFDCTPNLTIDQIKAKLLPELQSLGMRMEFGTTTWVHLDTRAPGPSGIYFHV